VVYPYSQFPKNSYRRKDFSINITLFTSHGRHDSTTIQGRSRNITCQVYLTLPVFGKNIRGIFLVIPHLTTDMILELLAQFVGKAIFPVWILVLDTGKFRYIQKYENLRHSYLKVVPTFC